MIHYINMGYAVNKNYMCRLLFNNNVPGIKNVVGAIKINKTNNYGILILNIFMTQMLIQGRWVVIINKSKCSWEWRAGYKNYFSWSPYSPFCNIYSTHTLQLKKGFHYENDALLMTDWNYNLENGLILERSRIPMDKFKLSWWFKNCLKTGTSLKKFKLEKHHFPFIRNGRLGAGIFWESCDLKMLFILKFFKNTV